MATTPRAEGPPASTTGVGPLFVVLPAHQAEDMLAMQVMVTFKDDPMGLDPGISELVSPPEGWTESAAVIETHRRFRVFTRKATSNTTPNPSMQRITGPVIGAGTVFAARAYSFVGSSGVANIEPVIPGAPVVDPDVTIPIDPATMVWSGVQPTVTGGSVVPIDPATLTWVGVDPTATVGSSLKQLSLPGTSGSYAQIPDAAALDLTNSHTVYMRVSVPDWTPSAHRIFLSKWGTAPELSYYWELRTDGQVNFQWTSNGTTIANQLTAGTGLGGLTGNTLYWIRLAFVGSTRTVTISWAPDAPTRPASGWTVVGTSGGGSASGTFDNSAEPLTIGSLSDGDYRNFIGEFAQIELVNDITATTAFTLDPNNWTTGATWVTASTHTVTMSGSATII